MSFTLDLNSIWFILVGVLLSGYAILDGFDLGVGALHLFTRNDTERRVLLNAIGPVWDGNEVWLVTGGGALFAAFPEAYATSFSGFYLAMFLVLTALIARAVAIEFRSKQPMGWWRSLWDVSFSAGSVLAALLLGTAMGNIARGVPLAADHEFAGSFLGLLHPFCLVAGITTVALFTLHGSLYLLLKTEGALYHRVRGWTKKTFLLFSVCYVLLTVATFVWAPRMVENLKAAPFLFVVPALNVLALASIPHFLKQGRDGAAFLGSCVCMLALLGLFGIGTWPNLIPALENPEHSLTIYNAASSEKTLTIMLIIAGIGMPLVIAYTVFIYRVFRGKVRLDATSY